jgi:hypothetical protein
MLGTSLCTYCVFVFPESWNGAHITITWEVLKALTAQVMLLDHLNQNFWGGRTPTSVLY